MSITPFLYALEPFLTCCISGIGIRFSRIECNGQSSLRRQPTRWFTCRDASLVVELNLIVAVHQGRLSRNVGNMPFCTSGTALKSGNGIGDRVGTCCSKCNVDRTYWYWFIFPNKGDIFLTIKTKKWWYGSTTGWFKKASTAWKHCIAKAGGCWQITKSISSSLCCWTWSCCCLWCCIDSSSSSTGTSRCWTLWLWWLLLLLSTRWWCWRIRISYK